MRPRTAFAILLAIGAVIHIPLIPLSHKSLVPMAVYAGWLLVSGAVALALWLRVSQQDPLLYRRALIRGTKVVKPKLEGLRGFVITAVCCFLLHALAAVSSSGPRPGQQGLWLVFFALAASCVIQLRGPVGDADAPIPDDSNVARVGHLLLRLMGVAMICASIGLFYLGITSEGASGGGFGFPLPLSWFFKGSGVLVFLVGLLFALLPLRHWR